MTMEVIMTVSDPPAFGEVRDGWYEENPNDWFLTWDALCKEYHTAGKKIAEVTVTTRQGRINKGRLRTAIKLNPHNNKYFIVYSLDDFDKLYREMQKQSSGLLPKAEVNSLQPHSPLF
jgi:hypothetical protein